MISKILDLKKVYSFTKVVETNSFARAAELLSYSPAALTLQIQSLEKDLDITLIDRLGKKISLTNAGVQFYEYAKELLHLNEDAIDAFQRDDSELCGHLRIGTISSLCSCLFPMLLNKFHTSYPLLSISVVTDTPAVLYKKLSYNELDIIIVLDEPLCRPDFISILSLPTSVVFCASKNHPLAGNKDISMDSLLAYPCILTEDGASYRHVFEKVLASKGKNVSPIVETDNVDLIFPLLKSSNEFSVLPSILFKSTPYSEEIVPLSLPNLDLSVQMQIFCNKNKYICREMKVFISIAKLHIYNVFQSDWQIAKKFE